MNKGNFKKSLIKYIGIKRGVTSLSIFQFPYFKIMQLGDLFKQVVVTTMYVQYYYI
jgi:hypothetical protein